MPPQRSPVLGGSSLALTLVITSALMAGACSTRQPARAPSHVVARAPLPRATVEQLERAAMEHYLANEMIVAQSLWERAINRGSTEYYNLACAVAINGDVERAVQLLHKAAVLDEVDARWAEIDPDLASLHEHGQWQALLAKLRMRAEYFRLHTPEQQTLIVPRAPGTELHAVYVWLHGHGGGPQLEPRYQQIADRYGVLFLGVSGTEAFGAQRFRWSDDLAQNAQRVRRALDWAATSARIRLPREVFLFGFSAGAQTALEVAAAEPGLYAGALAFSTGTLSDVRVPQAGDLSHQRYRCSAGSAEMAEVMRRSHYYCAHYRALGAQTVDVVVTDGGHQMPDDDAEILEAWIRESSSGSDVRSSSGPPRTIE